MIFRLQQMVSFDLVLWNLFVIWFLILGTSHHCYALFPSFYANSFYRDETPEKLNPSTLMAGTTVPVTKRLE